MRAAEEKNRTRCSAGGWQVHTGPLVTKTSCQSWSSFLPAGLTKNSGFVCMNAKVGFGLLYCLTGPVLLHTGESETREGSTQRQDEDMSSTAEHGTQGPGSQHKHWENPVQQHRSSRQAGATSSRPHALALTCARLPHRGTRSLQHSVGLHLPGTAQQRRPEPAAAGLPGAGRQRLCATPNQGAHISSFPSRRLAQGATPRVATTTHGGAHDLSPRHHGRGILVSQHPPPHFLPQPYSLSSTSLILFMKGSVVRYESGATCGGRSRASKPRRGDSEEGR